MFSQSAQSAPAILLVEDSSAEAVIDMSVLASFEEVQMEDEPDLIVELIDLYLDDAPHQLALMQAAIAGADAATLKRTAHGLKGSSANLGICRVAALCEELEHTDHDDSFW
jgi:HPt (histidine-containing phosphotransfer) domain-containing protein